VRIATAERAEAAAPVQKTSANVRRQRGVALRQRWARIARMATKQAIPIPRAAFLSASDSGLFASMSARFRGSPGSVS
jgi:hypothetical protein